MKFFLWVIVGFVLLVAAYFLWASSGKNYDTFNARSTFTGEVSSEGTQSAKGNLVAIQPYLVPADYCTPEHFKNALLPYFQKAKTEGFLGSNSIVILPEHAGTWLVTHHEKASVYIADSMMHAISLIVNSNLFNFIGHITSKKADDKIKQTLFLMKARSMGKVYAEVFSSLAKEFKVTIVAGSIVLPDPYVDNNGNLHNRKGLLYNTTFIFGPDGKIIGQPVKKEHPGKEERTYVSPARNGGNASIKTGSATISLAFGTDSTHREIQTGSIILMSLPDEDATDDERIKRNGNAILNSIYVSWCGRLWERNYEGRIVTQRGDSLKVFKQAQSNGRIVNLWLK